MSDGPLKIIYGLICDDVRREDNGKLIIIGAYGSNISVGTFPANLLLSCILIGEVLEPVEFSFAFEALYKDEVRVKCTGTLRLEERGDVLLNLPNLSFAKLPAPGILGFRLKQTGGKWQTIRTIRLVSTSA
jgi:uncharacterized protein DUF6941